tara:strand:- start:3695 stop:4615 length:921 start_codon:yes stop_codon:yes gene_type:complete
MATTESFSNLVLLYKGTNNVYNSFSGSYTVNDSADGNDGQTAVGDSVYFVQYSNSYSLVGTTANGVVISGPVYDYLITDGSYSNGDMVSVNTTDPYNYCFLEGTSINTPEGTRPVESIKIGDTVLSADGRELTVRWMGHETVRNGIGASIHKAPIKISAGAFGDGLPVSDLYVSNAHAFLLDGHLVVASALINGETITAVPFSDMPSEFTYWHIETEEHELVVANGVAAETLSGAPERKDFDNYDSYVAQYGADRIIQPMAYPRIKDVAQLPESLLERFNLARPALDWDALLNEDDADVVLKQANS